MRLRITVNTIKNSPSSIDVIVKSLLNLRSLESKINERGRLIKKEKACVIKTQDMHFGYSEI